jgi:hypothetical protein
VKLSSGSLRDTKISGGMTVVDRSSALSVWWNQRGKTVAKLVCTLSCDQISGVKYQVRDGPERR